MGEPRMMRRMPRAIPVVLVCALIAAWAPGLPGPRGRAHETAESAPVVVASKPFGESYLLC